MEVSEQVVEVLDPASVPDPWQAACTTRRRGRRKSSVSALQDCDLPRRGWGILRLRETRPRSGSAWTDSGEAHDRRGSSTGPAKQSAPCRSRPIS